MSLDRAVARLHPTEGNRVRGTVTFESMGEDGLRVETEVQHLPPGRHAYHVHLLGDCTGADGKSAGTHFNFRGPSKNPPKRTMRVTGNLGELNANTKGEAVHEDVISEASLTGAFSIVGRSVVVHLQDNDLAELPMGGAGARLACGVIGLTE